MEIESLETFVDLCVKGLAKPEEWSDWLGNQEKSDDQKPYELLGLLPQEFTDLNEKMRSMKFYVFKRRHLKSVFNVFPGAYVKYAFETDSSEPHFDHGWVDIVNPHDGFCRIQVDDDEDGYNGFRAVPIRLCDVMEVLPLKERPLVYYKSMICGKCNDCDRLANAPVPDSCPHFDKFSLILKKQKTDKEMIGIYESGKSKDLLEACRKVEEMAKATLS